MSTYMEEFLTQIEEQWKEVDVLIEYAKTVRVENNQLYNALCRSITILIVAHLEGFTKDLAKTIVYDLKTNVTFENLPTAIKRTYCLKYLEEDNINGINALIQKFEEINISIEYEPFIHAKNKNPKPSVIETIFNNFGISYIFNYLQGSTLDEAFSDTSNELKNRLVSIKASLNEHVKSFPFQFNLEEYQLTKSENKKYKNRTLWQTFLDDINQKRHNITHGNNFENVEDINDLEKSKDKVILLQFGLVAVFLSVISKKYN